MVLRHPRSQAASVRLRRRYVVDTVRVVALPSAMRDARNAQAFIEWVKSETGWNVEVISGLEEGRLIHLGVVTNERGARGRCLMIDLGGGSCEITLSDQGRIREMVSLPLGAVRLQQEFLQTDPPAKDDIARLKKFIRRESDEAADAKMGIFCVACFIHRHLWKPLRWPRVERRCHQKYGGGQEQAQQEKAAATKRAASAELVRASSQTGSPR